MQSICNLLTLTLFVSVTESVDVFAANLEELRQSIRNIYVLQDHDARKNSFVLSPERHKGHWTHSGYRYTLLDVHGQGSIRHIWTTRGEGSPYHTWEFYIDGESTPSISATDEELVAAAREVSARVAPANTVPLANRDFNLFLPVPFDSHCRIEVVQRVPSFWLWFCQIDYRLNDDSMEGVRLVATGTKNRNCT